MNVKTIKIDAELYEKMKKRYEKEQHQLLMINIKNVDEFIEYIIRNFDSSSDQFDELSEEQKNSFGNIDISNIDFNELMKTISSTFSKKEPKKDELDNQEDENDSSNNKNETIKN